MIHADAGVNAVRAYPVRRDGAGYTARIVDVLKSSTDPMFRPVDVAVAPDGSLLVADWYDPGVGGHDVGDLTHGRIIRVAPPGARYSVTPPNVSTVDGAAAALASPNVATRFLAHRALSQAGAGAEPALAGAWRSADQRRRARALWLLAALPDGRGARWIDAALADTNADIRITALRAVRRAGGDVLAAARRLASDPSPQVRREVALALRGQVGVHADQLWAQLAVQHDGRDRWYLEALGIGAEGQWTTRFLAWRGAVGAKWNTPAGRDIVWRARTDRVLPLLAELIQAPTTSPAERVRYLRALDFHEGPARQRLLLSLLDDYADQQLTTLVLAQLDTAGVADSPAIRSALARTLDATRGTQQFVDLVRKYDVRDAQRMDELLQLALAKPDQSEGVDAARLVLRRGGIAPFRAIVDGPDPDRAWSALTVVGRAGGSAADAYLEEIALSPARPLALRLAAVRLWGPGWGGQQRLLRLAQDGKLPGDLAPTAAEILRASYRPQVRDAATKLFGAPTLASADGHTLPAPRELAVRTGDVARGRAAFQRTCAACHAATPGAAPVFGPGLGEIGSKLAKEALYTAILHPSSGIAFGYEGTTLRLRDGSEATGIVASETADELSLRVGPGITTKYRKSEIASRAKVDRSLMPEGLASGLTEQQLVDLVEYLASLKRAEP
jgi:putative heme-binding domain-containing protein